MTVCEGKLKTAFSHSLFSNKIFTGILRHGPHKTKLRLFFVLF